LVRLSDGEFDVEFVTFGSAETQIAQFAGEASCIHHFSVGVDESAMKRMVPRLHELGCEVANDERTRTALFKIPPDGTVVAISPK
jgi:hypothetical protein